MFFFILLFVSMWEQCSLSLVFPAVPYNQFTASARLVADELSPRFLPFWYHGAPLCRLHKAQLLLYATSCNVGQGGFTHSTSSSIKKETMAEAAFECQLTHMQT